MRCFFGFHKWWKTSDIERKCHRTGCNAHQFRYRGGWIDVELMWRDRLRSLWNRYVKRTGRTW